MKFSWGSARLLRQLTNRPRCIELIKSTAESMFIEDIAKGKANQNDLIPMTIVMEAYNELKDDEEFI